MNKKEDKPKLNLIVYNCPHCGTYCNHMHYYISEGFPPDFSTKLLRFYYDDVESAFEILETYQIISRCQICKYLHLWDGGELKYPFNNQFSDPNKDLTKDVRDLYKEASNVFEISPKSAAALLRLSIEKLLENLGHKGSLNDKISSLVSEGVSDTLQMGLDSVRYYGNKGVHPGQLNLDEKREEVYFLFDLVNLIADELITKPYKVRDFYEKLPSSYKESIVRRDSKES